MRRTRRRTLPSTALLVLVFGSLACSPSPGEQGGTPESPGTPATPHCDAGNGGLTLPAGFCATIFADNVGGARHVAVAPNGDVLVASAGVTVLRDADGDGHADARRSFGPSGGTGIAIRDGFLYKDNQGQILRYALPAGSAPALDAYAVTPTTIVGGLPEGGHFAHNLVVDGSGNLFVNVGSATNSCQVSDRSPGSPGIDPCTELATRAGIWRFSASTVNQTFAQGERFATGIRNAMGLAFGPQDGALYATQHGRDELSSNWGSLFTNQQNADNPGEELIRVVRGDDFGWPYCFYSMDARALVLAPEYGGNGSTVGRCSTKKSPVVSFPGHWAPEALLFYSGSSFPAKYRNGAFVSFHGSWNRAPLPQDGFRVAFVPAAGTGLASSYEVFADGFHAGDHRPMGLALAPDGALFVTDDAGGRVWRIMYTGTP